MIQLHMSPTADEMPEKEIPLSEPFLTSRAKDYLLECVDTGWVSTVGPHVARLEQQLTRITNVQQTVAVCNGTSALHLALHILGIGPGDEVIAPTLSFVATVNPILYVGASPVLIDVRSDSWTIDVDLVRNFLEQRCERRETGTYNRTSGRRVRAIIPVHLFGTLAELDSLSALCDEFALTLIEDAAESFGAEYRGTVHGTLRDVSVLSFNGNKTFTAGAGGALLFRSEELATRALHVSTQAKSDALTYFHDELGFNFRMSNLNAAVALSQIEEMHTFLAKKREIAQRYRSALSEQVAEGRLRFQSEAPSAISSCWLTTVILQTAASGSLTEPGWKRAHVYLKSKGIQTRPFWFPLHRLPHLAAVQSIGGKTAEELYVRGLSLPSSVGLTVEQQDRIVDAIKGYILLP